MSIDLRHVFALDVSALQLVVRTSAVYIALLVAMRFISRREMGSFELPDLTCDRRRPTARYIVEAAPVEIILVRHAAVELDPAVLSALWPLSDAGRADARSLARSGMWRDVTRIFTSPELKAEETAHIIAGPNSMTVTAVEDLREVERPAGQWFEDYPAAVQAFFAAPGRATHGWESPKRAQERMVECIRQLASWEPGGFAIAGHDLTLSLYLSTVTDLEAAALWPTIRLPDVAVLSISRGVVVRPFGRPLPVGERGREGT
ncbi:MAG: histidine phosphatase family protein [Chloroflexi bacterium]|nr:histidine phosphatase family protein [Chloroflexota bacterium]